MHPDSGNWTCLDVALLLCFVCLFYLVSRFIYW